MLKARQMIGTVIQISTFAYFGAAFALFALVAAAPLRVEATTWYQSVDDTFTRANTSTSTSAGSTNGVGNGWIDITGGVWNISNNQLQGVSYSSSDFTTKFLTRPSSENSIGQRLVATIPAGENFDGNFLGLGLRYQATTSNYYLTHISATGIYLYKIVGGGVTSLGTLSTSLNTSHSYIVDFAATGTSPTNLAVRVTDLTSSTTVGTLTGTDSEASLQTSGRFAFTTWHNYGVNYIRASRAQTYTSTPSDVTPPVISAIASTTSQTTATITWTTNESATSAVNYGTTTSYGASSSSATLRTSQSITLSGLTPGTTYNFQVSSADASNNLATSTNLTFRTVATSSAPVAYWNMDEASGDALDSSGSSLDLWNFTSGNRTKGVLGNAAVFNGNNFFAGTGPSLANGSFTVSGWLYADDFTGQMVWLSMGSNSSTNNALHLRVYDDGRMLMGFFLNDLQATGFTTNSWHHAAYTYDVSTGARKVYLDGALKASDTSAPFTGDTSMAIGDWNGYEYWKGKIDEARIYNRALSQSEISSLYDSGAASLASQLSAASGCGSTTRYVGSRIITTKCDVTTVFETNPPASAPVLSVSTSAPVLLPVTAMLSSSSTGPALLPMPVLATSTQVASGGAYAFMKNLTIGSSGPDVKKLQQMLNARNFAVATSGPGSLGNETEFFGRSTANAVARLQRSYSIFPSVGYFGPVTRALLNSWK